MNLFTNCRAQADYPKTAEIDKITRYGQETDFTNSQKKYVLLREFARQNKEWAEKADLIEYLYTDEAEHQEEIQRLWENRHKRLERRETKSIGHP